jgi:hypothetical protein
MAEVYEESAAVTEVAEAIRATLVTDRLRLDQAAVEDVVRVVRGVLRASSIDRGGAQMNAELV